MDNTTSLIFYIIIFIISSICIQIGEYEKKNRILIVIGLAIPIVVATIRYGVGTDYFNYLGIMKSTGAINLQKYIVENGFNEIGSYFSYRLGYLSGNYHSMLFLNASLTILPIYFALRREKNFFSISLGFLLFLFIYFPTSFNIMMQMMALSFFTLSFKYIFERKFYKYIFVILCASMFHSTALVCMPLYLLGDTDKVNKFLNFKYMIAIIIGIFVFLNIEHILIALGEIDTFSSYGMYATKDSSGGNRDLLVKIMLFMIVFLFRKNLIKYDKRNALFILLLFFNVLIGFTGIFSPFIKRLGYYFEVVQIYILPMLVRVSKNKRERALYGMLIILYAIALFILVAYILRQGNIIPYRINL